MSLLFNGDYSGSGGVLFGWPGYQHDIDKPNAITRVTNPHPEGISNYAGRIQVDSGDLASDGNRAEVRHHSTTLVETNGTRHFITFGLYLPGNIQAVQPTGGTGFLIPFQLHANAGMTQANIRWNIVGVNQLNVAVYGAPNNTQKFNATIGTNILAAKDTWHFFISECLFSNQGNGALGIWHRNETQASFTKYLDRTGISNIEAAGESYWKSGIYRSSRTFSTVLFHSALRWYTTFAEAQAYLTGSVTPPATLSISTTSLDSGTVAQPYSDTLQASGGSPPYTWSIVTGTLPAGLSLNAGSGVISGTPTAAGTSNFTVRAQDSAAASVQRPLSITLTAASTTLTVTTTSPMPQAQQNAAYSRTLTASGGTAPYTWSIEGTAAVAGEYYLSTSELAEIAASITNPATPWVGVAWNLIEARADAALGASPNVSDPSASYTSQTGVCTGANRGWHPCLYTPGRTDGHRARELALKYRLEGDVACGNKARDFCLAWATGWNPPPSQPQIGHYVAEPLGPVILLCLAFLLCQDRFSASQATTFRNWASIYVARGQNNCDHGVDDVSDSFWGATDTISGETQRSNAWGNNTAWQRCMAVVAAAAVGGVTLSSCLDWNWNHTTAGGRNNGWTTWMSNHISASGETFEGRRRQSLGYGIWSVWAGAFIADIAKHAGFHTDLFNFVTPSGNSLLQPWLFYGPAIAGGAWPYSAADGFMDGASQATMRTHYRAAAETALRHVNPGAIKTQLQTIVAVGGTTARGQNSEDHLAHENSVTSEARTIGGGAGAGQLPPGLSLATSTGVISGTPTTLGTFAFTVKVTDNVGATDTQALSIEVISGTPDPDPDPPGPTVLPTLPAGKVRYGFATFGSTLRGMSANVKRMSLIAVPVDVIVDKLWIGLAAATSGTQVFTLDVYDDSGGSGEPGSLEIESAEQSKIGPFASGWHSVDVTPSEIAAGNYWGGTHSGGSGNLLQYAAEALTAGLRYGSDTYPGAADPAGAMSTDNWRMSFVIEGTPVDVPPPGGDVTPPSPGENDVDGTTLRQEFDEPLASPAPAASAFAVTVNGGAPVAPASVAISANANELLLTLASAVSPGNTVDYSYTPPGSNKLRDAAGNEVPSYSFFGVPNITAATDVTAPALQSVSIDASTLTAVFDEALATPPPAASTFSVTIAGTPQAPTTAAISGTTLTLTLGSGASAGQNVSWTWTTNGTNPIRDLAGNALSSLSGTVTNVTPGADVTAPTVSGVSVNGPTLTAIFSESLATPAPAASAFEVSIAANPQTPTGVSLSGNILTLTLAIEAQAGQAALWSYTQPASNKLRDLAPTANNVATFSNQSVTNVTQAPPQPEPARPLRSFPFENEFPVTRP